MATLPFALKIHCRFVLLHGASTAGNGKPCMLITAEPTQQRQRHHNRVCEAGRNIRSTADPCSGLLATCKPSPPLLPLATSILLRVTVPCCPSNATQVPTMAARRVCMCSKSSSRPPAAFGRREQIACSSTAKICSRLCTQLHHSMLATRKRGNNAVSRRVFVGGIQQGSHC